MPDRSGMRTTDILICWWSVNMIMTADRARLVLNLLSPPWPRQYDLALVLNQSIWCCLDSMMTLNLQAVRSVDRSWVYIWISKNYRSWNIISIYINIKKTEELIKWGVRCYSRPQWWARSNICPCMWFHKFTITFMVMGCKN